MAQFAYFADLPDGTLLEWRYRVEWREDAKGMARRRVIEPKVAHRADGFYGYDETRGWVKITRRVQLKSNPSKHVCDPRCQHATGRTMQCECACGGRNHGRGSAMVCEAA